MFDSGSDLFVTKNLLPPDEQHPKIKGVQAFFLSDCAARYTVWDEKSKSATYHFRSCDDAIKHMVQISDENPSRVYLTISRPPIFFKKIPNEPPIFRGVFLAPQEASEILEEGSRRYKT